MILQGCVPSVCSSPKGLQAAQANVFYIPTNSFEKFYFSLSSQQNLRI